MAPEKQGQKMNLGEEENFFPLKTSNTIRKAAEEVDVVDAYDSAVKDLEFFPKGDDAKAKADSKINLDEFDSTVQ